MTEKKHLKTSLFFSLGMLVLLTAILCSLIYLVIRGEVKSTDIELTQQGKKVVKRGLISKQHPQLDPQIVKYTEEFDARDGLLKQMSNEEDGSFALTLRVWDNSVRVIADFYDSKEDIRLAVRPYGEWWIDDYIWLIEHIRKKGYEFGQFNDAASLGPVETKKVYLRYDIHLRDIAPLYPILDTNLALKVPSTSFLLWDYSDREYQRRADFENLNKFKHDSVTFGLHISPIPTYFEKVQRASNSNTDLMKLITSDAIESLVANSDADSVTKLRADAILLAKETARSFKKSFPDSKLISMHGSGFDQKVKSVCRNQADTCDMTKKLSAISVSDELESALNEDWVVVDNSGFQTPSDTLETKKLLCLIERLILREESFSLLVHPAQLFRNRRKYSEIGYNPGDSLEQYCREAPSSKTAN
jgi:hypothetical protein